MKRFDEMTLKSLWELRKEICLNSLYVADYFNSFEFDSEDICSFFDGYTEYLDEMAQELGGAWYQYDNANNLWDYFLLCDDYSWVRTSNIN